MGKGKKKRGKKKKKKEKTGRTLFRMRPAAATKKTYLVWGGRSNGFLRPGRDRPSEDRAYIVDAELLPADGTDWPALKTITPAV